MRFTDCLSDTTIDRSVRAFAVDPGVIRTSMTDLQLFSDAGKAHLPGIQKLFDDGVDILSSRAAESIADIAARRFDPLAGRLPRGVDDRDLLERNMQAIIEQYRARFVSAASRKSACDRPHCRALPRGSPPGRRGKCPWRKKACSHVNPASRRPGCGEYL